MKWKYKRLFCLFCALCLWAGGLPGVRASEDLESRQGRIDAIEEEKERVQNKLSELDKLKDDASAYLAGINEELAAVESSLSDIEGRMESTRQEIDEALLELETARETEKTQYENMKLRIQYMYEKGDTYFLELLFESADLSEFLSQAEYISKISEYDRTMLAAYQDTKEFIASKTEELEASYASLEIMMAEAEAKQTSLSELEAAKQTELAAINDEISENQELVADYDEALKEEMAEFQALEEEIRKREEAEALAASKAAEKATESEQVTEAPEAPSTDTGGAAEPSSGETESAAPPTEAPTKPSTEAPAKPPAATGFIWPVPSCGRISSGYGSRDDPLTGESDGALSDHHGIDIALPGGALAGADIVAAADGEVIIARKSSSAGNWIILYHGNSTYTVYMHCQKLFVSEGDRVKQGETIALVGNTGWSTGPHLHFEVRVGGFSSSRYSRNPLNYVSPP